MILVVDIGNTNITFGVFDSERLKASFRLSSNKYSTKDEYAAVLDSILKVKNIKSDEIKGAIIGSVVPVLSNPIKKAINLVLGVNPKEVEAGMDLGLTMEGGEPLPLELGADILEFAIAVKEMYKKPTIMIDVGTATTIFALSEKLELLGGLIIAGPATSVNYLVEKTALLTSTNIKDTNEILGINSNSCISSGYLFGGSCMIDGVCDKIERRLGYNCLKIATGGLARKIINHCDQDIIFENDIILKGLKVIYDKIIV